MGVSRSPQVIKTVIASSTEVNHIKHPKLYPMDNGRFKTYTWDSEYKNISINEIKENGFLWFKNRTYNGIKGLLENI